MLPGRLGLRFALEALFLVLLAIGAGLADLRPALIVLVMAVAWLLVAIVEFTAERISASPSPTSCRSGSSPRGTRRKRCGRARGTNRGGAARSARARAGPAAESEPEPKPEEGTRKGAAAEPEPAADRTAAAPVPLILVAAASRSRASRRGAETREAPAPPICAAGEPGRAGGGRALRQAR